MRACVLARACMRACVRVRAREHVRAHVHACLRARARVRARVRARAWDGFPSARSTASATSFSAYTCHRPVMRTTVYSSLQTLKKYLSTRNLVMVGICGSGQRHLRHRRQQRPQPQGGAPLPPAA